MTAACLFVHNAFPAQFGPLAAALAARGVRCAAIGETRAAPLEGVELIRYGIPRSSTPGIYPLAGGVEADMIRAKMAYLAARRLKAQGFEPQVIVGHTSWGETLLLDEVFPEARQALYPEFFRRGADLELGFDPEFPPTSLQALAAKPRNVATALALTDADAVVCPTRFQAGTLPDIYRPRVRIIHEGVDVDAVRPGPAPELLIPGGPTIAPGTPVITHVNNQLEPARGLHIFLRALPRVLAEVPEAQVLIFGHPVTLGYSGPAPQGKTWKDVCLEGVTLDPARVHFLGNVPREQLHLGLRASAAHVYYSWPFVLSWSLLEAMAAGCHVIGSDTDPVREVIEDGVNGRLLPFFDVDALSEALVAACRDPQAAAPLRSAARRTVEQRYARAQGLAAWFALLRELGLDLPVADGQ